MPNSRIDDDQLSDADIRIAEHVAQTVVARLLEAIRDDRTVDSIVDKWSGSVDRTIGRGLRRLACYVCQGLIGLASVKLGLTEILAGLFKP